MEDELEKHIEILIRAISSVDASYLWYGESFNECAVNDRKIQHLERTFAYELYHKWRLLLNENFPNIVLNAEISKAVYDNLTQNTVFPDFVLHHGQGSDSNQILVCEVKRRYGLTPQKIQEDIIALASYLNNKTFSHNPFKLGVFILVGADIKYLKEQLLKFNLFSIANYLDKIICITYDAKTKCTYEKLSVLLGNER